MSLKLMSMILFISLIVLILISLVTHREYFENGTKEITPKLNRPFVNLYDNNGNALNVYLISKPFRNKDEYKIYEDNKDKNIFLGICSYLEFPNKPSNPFENFDQNYKDFKYKEICEGWIHGFRDPENYFPPEIPLMFASESDWTDCNVSKPIPNEPKIYDFIYICLKADEKKSLCDDWATYNKNWKLAKKCLDVFCNEYKLKGLLIGRKGCELPNGCKHMDSTDMLKYHELQKMYSKCKFIFIPNEKDASPRVLTEALASNIACLVNKNILGGWKYVNDKTGEFFNDEKDLPAALDKLLHGLSNNKYDPRNYFVTNYSVENSGKRLKEFLYKHWGDRITIPESQVKFISPEFVKKNFKTCKSVINPN